MALNDGFGDVSDWDIYITNDNCPDYTWGFTEEQVRQGLADLVAAHLDLMKETDRESEENRDQYNMAVTQEALCFAERYPERTQELIHRIREGRICVSPFLCNSLPAFQSVEGVIRTLYPARRLEVEWGIPIDVAEHIEEPSLPWGLATLLAGCGVRWLSKPYYAYGDSMWGSLENPPLFRHEGPDGSHLRVILDPYASGQACYTQGASLLRQPNRILEDWIPHYRGLGALYPLKAVLASGTHLDITPTSYQEPPVFAAAIKAYNEALGPHPRMVNATLRQFCEAVDQVERAQPFLPVVRGCFGHGWDTWPVSLAKYAARMREGERALLAAEALLVLASTRSPSIGAATAPVRCRAEWCLAMLGDHALNAPQGDYPSAEELRRHNAELRRRWAEELDVLAARLMRDGWRALGLAPTDDGVTVLNPLSVPRSDLVRVRASGPARVTDGAGRPLPTQVVTEGGGTWLYFASPLMRGHSIQQLHLGPGSGVEAAATRLRASEWELDSPFYRVCIAPRTGAVARLIHKASGVDVVSPTGGRSLCETIYYDGSEQLMAEVASEVVSVGPVLARIKTTGLVAGIRVTTAVTVYAELDRVDFDLSVKKPLSTVEQRLCHVFPVTADITALRVETTGAVITPSPQPVGDLLPGADSRKLAVQSFVDALGAGGTRVLIAPLDGFLLRLDLEPLTFEALGNDQNYPEVSRDQNGVSDFRFRYAVCAYQGQYDPARAAAWSRAAANPLVVTQGLLPADCTSPCVTVDSSRAVATCLKPADGAAEGAILRLWETSGRPGPLALRIAGFSRCLRTDLLERDLEEIDVRSGTVFVDLSAYGFTAVRLLP